MRPLNDKVLLLFPDSEEYVESAGGILVKRQANQRLDATVVAVGPLVPSDIRVGDRVLAEPFSGMVCDYEGVRYREVPADQIMAVITA